MANGPTITQADRLSYPGMLPGEIAILKAWLVLHESEYTEFDYNVRVGKGVDPGPSYPQNMRDMSIANTQLRIDAEAWQGDQATLIEVKKNAQPAAIGQLLSYYALWVKDNPTLPAPKLLLVTNAVYEDLATALQHANIKYDVVQSG